MCAPTKQQITSPVRNAMTRAWRSMLMSRYVFTQEPNDVHFRAGSRSGVHHGISSELQPQRRAREHVCTGCHAAGE